MAVSGARRVQRFAQNGVPVGDWTHQTGRLDRPRAVSALQTSSPARVLLAVLVGVAVGWVLDLALGKGPSVWQLLPLAAFLLMITVTAQTGFAREAVRLAAGLDATRIPAVALADVSPENSLAPGGLLREQATLRYGPELVAAALGQCSSYQGTVLDLMEELASTVRGDALQRQSPRCARDVIYPIIPVSQVQQSRLRIGSGYPGPSSRSVRPPRTKIRRSCGLTPAMARASALSACDDRAPTRIPSPVMSMKVTSSSRIVMSPAPMRCKLATAVATLGAHAMSSPPSTAICRLG